MSLTTRTTSCMSAVIPASSDFALKLSPHRDPVEHCPCGYSQSGKYRIGGESGDQPLLAFIATKSCGIDLVRLGQISAV